MQLFRLAKLKYSKDVSGKGAEIAGARWNSKGIAMLYTAQSVALATTEIAVHVPLGILPKGYVAITYELPEEIRVEELKETELPNDFSSIPHSYSTQVIGDEFVMGKRTLVLKVPSVVVPGDYNFLINPNHQDINKLVILDITPYEFDYRLFFR